MVKRGRKLSVLAFREIVRPATQMAGGFQTGRRSVDFMVDGKSLLEMLDRASRFKSDLMGCLVSGFPDANTDARARLLTEGKPDSPDGRVLLYICPECGDVGCGAYGARIERQDETIIWRDFAHESAGETVPIVLPPFVFESRPYRDVIAAATAQLSA